MSLSHESLLSPEQADQLIGALEESLQHRFQNHTLALTALTHRSLSDHKSGQSVEDNERLEFLGDAVVNWLVVEELYRRYPSKSEGKLSALKAKFVSTAPFAECATELGLHPLLQMNSSAERSGTRNRPNIREDLFEAVVGALYLDGGIEPVRRLLERVLFPKFDDLNRAAALQNFKGELNEELQKKGKPIASYSVVEILGPDHDQQFIVEVAVEERPAGRGEGSTKLAAEQQAASVALSNLRSAQEE